MIEYQYTLIKLYLLQSSLRISLPVHEQVALTTNLI